DQWVDDLVIERWATTRGSNPSAFALPTSTNTETMSPLAARGRRWLHFWWHVTRAVTHLAICPTGSLRAPVVGPWGQ
ncbi:MAG TPA: hypothetical protein VE673_00280, partial [Pseudonocardiaceae bacterium]|nr:hypothetical protein [Pseudonocardiaceae bacterium]